MSEQIRFYGPDAAWGVFSNFSKHGFEADGYLWYTSEHYYQAYKFVPGGERFMAIKNAGSPGKAKILGNKRGPDMESIRMDWEDGVKLSVMRRALRAKFEQNEDAYNILMSTGDAELVEDAPKDPYWGTGDGSGMNWLGKLLMELRTQFRQEEKARQILKRKHEPEIPPFNVWGSGDAE